MFIFYIILCSILVACRDGRIYNIKEGDIRGTALLTGNVIDTSSQIIAMSRNDKVSDLLYIFIYYL
jgi:hypothetical protein